MELKSEKYISLKKQVEENYNSIVKNEKSVLEVLGNQENQKLYLVNTFDSQNGEHGYQIIAATNLFGLSKALIDQAENNSCLSVTGVYIVKEGLELEKANTGLGIYIDDLLSFLQRGCLDYPAND